MAESLRETSDADDILYVCNDKHTDSKINGCLEALNALSLGQNLEPFKKCVEKYIQKMNARLSGHISIRKPYQGEIVKNVPFEMFLGLNTSVQHSRKVEITNNVVYSDNKKQPVMSFSSKNAVIVLLSVLSGYSEANVKGFFKKILTGRKHGNARVIVNNGQEFCFTYKIKTRQFYPPSTTETHEILRMRTRVISMPFTLAGKLDWFFDIKSFKIYNNPPLDVKNILLYTTTGRSLRSKLSFVLVIFWLKVVMASSHTSDANLFEPMLDAGNAGLSGLLDENDNGAL